MAGDWIKLQHATPDKPEVFRIGMELGIPPEHVSGCLLRVWIWADIQTLNGNGICVTGVTLDRIACYAGFAQAMKKVGWLIGDEANYSFPNFDRHNGETAKTRAQTRDRVQKHRNAKTVTPALPREEKRREDIKEVNTKARFDPLSIVLPDCIPDLAWRKWVEYRKSIGKKVQEQTWLGMAKKLAELNALGQSPERVIDESIANGWQGLFELKTPNQSAKSQRSSNVAYLTGELGKNQARLANGEVITYV
jgi:hypothetical protein